MSLPAQDSQSNNDIRMESLWMDFVTLQMGSLWQVGIWHFNIWELQAIFLSLRVRIIIQTR